MGNRVHVGLRKIEEVELDGTSTYAAGPWLQIYGWDDSDECGEYVGEVGSEDYKEYIEKTLTDPVAALSWLNEHEDEFAGLFDWAMENGMYLMGDWLDAEELKAAWAIEFGDPEEE